MPGRELADFSGVSEDNICLLKGAIGEFQRCVESRSPFTSEAKYEQDDGLPTWVQNTFTPIFGESGAVEKILITSVEITQLKETQERLATSLTRVLSGFVTICATCKDIRNDLNQWERVETYLDNDANDVMFSHGYCPKCFDLAMKELK